MGAGSSSNRRKQKEAQDRNSRSYLLQAIALLIFAGLMLYVFSDYADYVYTQNNLDVPDYLNTLISACTFMVVGCVLAIVFYSCECNPLVRFVVAVAIMIGAILFIAGYNHIISNFLNCDSDCDSDRRANLWAMPLFCLCVCILVSIQICTDVLNDETKRVVAQCVVLLIFAALLLPVYYNTNQDYLTDEEKSIESGGTILWIACLVTIVVFVAMRMESGNRIVRMILVAGILAGAIILFSGYSAIVDKYLSDSRDSVKINYMAPGILCLLIGIVLAIDVLF